MSYLKCPIYEMSIIHMRCRSYIIVCLYIVFLWNVPTANIILHLVNSSYAAEFIHGLHTVRTRVWNLFGLIYKLNLFLFSSAGIGNSCADNCNWMDVSNFTITPNTYQIQYNKERFEDENVTLFIQPLRYRFVGYIPILN